MDAAKIREARRAGYSDKEIADFLGASDPKIQAAREEKYSDTEILDHLSPPPSLGRRALDAVGDVVTDVNNYKNTRLSNVAGSVAGLPRMVVDLHDATSGFLTDKAGLPPWLARTITSGPLAPTMALASANKDVLPTGQGVTIDLLKSRAAADPTFRRTDLPGNVGKVIDKGVEAIATGPLLGAGKAGPLLNFMGGAGSEAARLPFEGTPYEIPATIAGGVGGLGLGALLTKAGQAGAQALRTLTGKNTDAIVGKALVDRAADPKAAIQAMEAYTPPVPGFNVNAGKASRDPGLIATEEVLAPRDPSFGLRAQNNNRVLTDVLDTASGGLPAPSDAGGIIQRVLGERVAQLVKQRKDAVDPLYRQAREFPDDVRVGPLFDYTAQQIAANKGEPQAVMTQARKLLFDAKGQPDWSASGAMSARKAIGDMLDNQQLGNHSRSLLLGMKSKLDDVLSTVPEEAQARAKFAEMSKPLEPFGDKTRAGAIGEKDRFGKGFVMPADKATGDLSARTVQNILMAAGGDPTVKKALQSAFFADFKKAASSTVQEDAVGNKMLLPSGASKWLEANRGAAANVLTPDQVKGLEAVARALKDQAQTVPGRAGSPTFDRMATNTIVDALLYPKAAQTVFGRKFDQIVQWGLSGANERAMERLLEVMADPKVAAALMKKATEGNVDMAMPLLQRALIGVPASAAPDRRVAR